MEVQVDRVSCPPRLLGLGHISEGELRLEIFGLDLAGFLEGMGLILLQCTTSPHVPQIFVVAERSGQSAE